MKRILFFITALLAPYHGCYGMLGAQLTSVIRQCVLRSLPAQRSYCSTRIMSEDFGMSSVSDVEGSLERHFSSKKRERYSHEVGIDYLQLSPYWFFDPISNKVLLEKIFRWHAAHKQHLIIHPVGTIGDRLTWHMLQQGLIEPKWVCCNTIGTQAHLECGDPMIFHTLLWGITKILGLDGSYSGIDTIKISKKISHKSSATDTTNEYDAIDLMVTDSAAHQELKDTCKRVSLLQIGRSTYRNMFDVDIDYDDDLMP